MCNFGSFPGNQNSFLAKEDKARKAKLLLPRHDGWPALDLGFLAAEDWTRARARARKDDKEKAEVLYVSCRVWCRISGNLFKTHYSGYV